MQPVTNTDAIRLVELLKSEVELNQQLGSLLQTQDVRKYGKARIIACALSHIFFEGFNKNTDTTLGTDRLSTTDFCLNLSPADGIRQFKSRYAGEIVSVFVLLFLRVWYNGSDSDAQRQRSNQWLQLYNGRC